VLFLLSAQQTADFLDKSGVFLGIVGPEAEETVEKVVGGSLADGGARKGLWSEELWAVEKHLLVAAVFVLDELLDGGLVVVGEGEVVGALATSLEEEEVGSSQFHQGRQTSVCLMHYADHQWSETLNSLQVDHSQVLLRIFLVLPAEKRAERLMCVVLAGEMEKVPAGEFRADFLIAGDDLAGEVGEEGGGVVAGEQFADFLLLGRSDEFVGRHVLDGEVELAGEFVHAVQLLQDVHVGVARVFQVHPKLIRSNTRRKLIE
jgi:hypothetical protein